MADECKRRPSMAQVAVYPLVLLPLGLGSILLQDVNVALAVRCVTACWVARQLAVGCDLEYLVLERQAIGAVVAYTRMLQCCGRDSLLFEKVRPQVPCVLCARASAPALKLTVVFCLAGRLKARCASHSRHDGAWHTCMSLLLCVESGAAGKRGVDSGGGDVGRAVGDGRVATSSRQRTAVVCVARAAKADARHVRGSLPPCHFQPWCSRLACCGSLQHTFGVDAGLQLLGIPGEMEALLASHGCVRGTTRYAARAPRVASANSAVVRLAPCSQSQSLLSVGS